ncbi:MAG: hypothetical protein Fues2KO_16600 [Fuerstiella sp.]
MVWYDIVVLTILIFTTWRGAQRGLVTQLAWIAAAVLCFKFADTLAPSLTPHISVGEPNDRVRHWIAMFILFVGFSIGSFLVARTIENTLKKAKLKELDRFLGAALGFIFGWTLVMVATFFTAVLPPTRAAVLESRTGDFACQVLDTIKPLTPEHFHEYLVEYQRRLPHDSHEHLGEGSTLPGFLGDDEDFDLDSGQGGTDWLNVGSGSDSNPDRPAPADRTPTLDQLWRELPTTLRNQFGDQLQQQWNSASPDQRRRLIDDLARTFDAQAPEVVSRFLASMDVGSTADRETDRMLNEIGDVYQDREQIVRRTREHLAGIPSAVQQAVIEDWYADLNLLADPDPGTTVQTRLDERILRQLERAKVPFSNLGFELRQRLNRSRR